MRIAASVEDRSSLAVVFISLLAAGRALEGIAQNLCARSIASEKRLLSLTLLIIARAREKRAKTELSWDTRERAGEKKKKVGN